MSQEANREQVKKQLGKWELNSDVKKERNLEDINENG